MGRAVTESLEVMGLADRRVVMIALFGLFAEVERDLISERTKEGLAAGRVGLETINPAMALLLAALLNVQFLTNGGVTPIRLPPAPATSSSRRSEERCRSS